MKDIKIYNFTSIDSADLNQEDVLLDFFLCSMCNLKCPYCIVSQERKTFYLISKNDVDLVLNSIRASERSFKITLLGGEPFLHPHIRYIIEELDKMPNVKRIWVFTNGTKLVPFKSKKTTISISYHSIQPPEVIYSFLHEAKKLVPPERLNLSIMCYQLRKNLEKYKDVILKSKEIVPGIIVDLEPIVIKNKVQEKELLSSLLEYQNSNDAFIIEEKEYNVYDVYKMIEEGFNLSEYSCILNRYYIGRGLVVENYMSEKCSGVPQRSNLHEDPLFFKKVKIPLVKCSKECNKRCVLDQDIGNPKIRSS